jgi:hypothetical protein
LTGQVFNKEVAYRQECHVSGVSYAEGGSGRALGSGGPKCKMQGI